MSGRQSQREKEAKTGPAKENRQFFLAMTITERDQVSAGDHRLQTEREKEGDRRERHTQLAYSNRLPVNLCSHMVPYPPSNDPYMISCISGSNVSTLLAKENQPSVTRQAERGAGTRRRSVFASGR